MRVFKAMAFLVTTFLSIATIVVMERPNFDNGLWWDWGWWHRPPLLRPLVPCPRPIPVPEPFIIVPNHPRPMPPNPSPRPEPRRPIAPRPGHVHRGPSHPDRDRSRAGHRRHQDHHRTGNAMKKQPFSRRLRHFCFRLHDAWYWLKCRLWHRYNVVVCRALPPTWCDRDYLLLYAAFQILEDFVQQEKGHFYDDVYLLYLDCGEVMARERAAEWDTIGDFTSGGSRARATPISTTTNKTVECSASSLTSAGISGPNHENAPLPQLLVPDSLGEKPRGILPALPGRAPGSAAAPGAANGRGFGL